MSAGFAKFKHPSVLIVCPGDMDYLRGSTIKLFRQLQLHVANDHGLDVYDYVTETREAGFKSWTHAQLQIPPPTDRLCQAVICFFGERVGTPVSAEVPLDSIAGSPALTRTSGPRAIRAGDDPATIADGFPLTGSTFEYLAAIEEAQRRHLPVLLLVVAEDEVLTKGVGKARWGDRREFERMRKEFGDDLDGWSEWLETEYRPQLQSLRNFAHYVSNEKGDVPLVQSGDEAIRRVRRFLTEDVGLRDAEHERSPFKGLEPYDVDDWSIFFGRGEWRRGAIAALISLMDRPDEPNLFHIVGGSGSGKSSLMRAGLIGPMCYQAWYGDFVACVVRPQDIAPDVRQATTNGKALPVIARLFARALEAIDPSTDPAQEEASLSHVSPEHLVTDAVTRLGSAIDSGSRTDAQEVRRLIIGIDQFEEIVDAVFTPEGERTWGPLLKFMETAASDPRMVVVCTVQTNRRELMERAGIFAGLYGKGHTKEVFAPLEIVDIVQNPFALRKRKLEPRLEDALVARIRRLFGSDLYSSVLPLVSLTLTRLYAEWERRRSVEPVMRQDAPQAAVSRPPSIADPSLKERAAKTFAGAAGAQGRGRPDAAKAVWELKYEDYKDFIEIEDAIGKAADLALEDAKSSAISWDDDAIASLLRRLVRLTSDNRLSFPSVELPTGTLMRRLAESLSQRRLVAREGPDRFRLVHEAVVQHWKAAREWLAAEQVLLERFATLKPTAKRWRNSRDRDALLDGVGGLQLQDGAELLAQWLDVLGGTPSPPADSDEALVREFALALMLRVGTPAQEVASPNRTTRHVHLAASYGRIDIVSHFLGIDGSAATLTRSDGRTPLFNGCWAGAADVVQLLLAHGAPAAQVDVDGWLPAHAAASVGSVECLLMLSRETPVLNAAGPNGVTPLHLAAENGHVDAARVLLDDLRVRGVAVNSVVDSRGWTPLHTAAGNSDQALARLFVEHGADVRQTEHQGWTPLHLAVQQSSSADVTRLLLDGGAEVSASMGRGYQPLHIAAQNGSESAARLLLDAGASPSAALDNGWTPLHIAVSNNRVGVARLLLERRGTTEAPAFNDWRVVEPAKDAAPTTWGNGGWRPLHVAATRGHEGMLSLLLEFGAHIESTNDSGRTPLHVAVEGGHSGAVALLLGRRADCAVRDLAGVSPLDISLKAQRFDIARLLVRAGADPRARNSEGMTLLDTAVRDDQDAVARFLLSVDPSGSEVAASRLGPALLHVAAERGLRTVVAALLDTGIDVDLRDAFGWTAVHIAAQNGYRPLLEELADRGANLSGRALEPPLTPLQAAAETGQSHCLVALVARGVDIADEHAERGSALYLAFKNGHFGAALQLLELGADPRRTDIGRQPPVADLIEFVRVRRRNVGDRPGAEEEHLVERLRQLGYTIPPEPAPTPVERVEPPASAATVAQQPHPGSVPPASSLIESIKAIAWPATAQRFDPLQPVATAGDSPWLGASVEFRNWFARQAGTVDGQYAVDSEDTEIALRALPWYDSIRLLRVRHPGWRSRLHLFYLVDEHLRLFRLNGASTPIHDVNEKAPVRLGEANALDYLRSFCFFVRGEEGPFYILEDRPDALLSSSDAAVQSVLESVAVPATYDGLNAQGHFLCSGVISYSAAIFKAKFAVQPNGVVEMLDDEPIAADLPVRVDVPLT